MIRLLGRADSLNVRKVLWLADELGLPIEREDWGRGYRSTGDPAFLRWNPNGLVPVLLDDDFALWESNAICRYLAAREGRIDLLPVDPRSRARVEQWMDWQATAVNDVSRHVFRGRVRRQPAYQDPEAMARAEQAWHRLMGILDSRLQETGAFVTGPVFTLADVVLGLATHRWFTIATGRPELPAVADYYERLSGRTAFLRHGRNGLP
jgi:glutathione S-transferase